MKSANAPRGLIADLITPLTEEGSIDGRGLGKLLDRLLPFSQALFLSSPQTGEGITLSSEQRLELLEKALVVIRGRTPVFFWITQDTEEKTRDLIMAARSTVEKRHYRGQVFWVDTPLYYHSNRGLPAFYQSLCSLVPGPFILHNDPALIRSLTRTLKRTNIRTAILKELVQFPQIAGLIFLGSLDRVHNYQRACHHRAKFRIYDGDESQFLDHPSMGGVVSPGANLAPKTWQRIAASALKLDRNQSYQADDHRQVWELGQYLRDLLEIYQRAPIILMKAVLLDLGVLNTDRSTVPFQETGDSGKRILDLLHHYGDDR
jgi:dihydrodipicolinate synthase/N-acetylneuraminate lyase